MSRILLSELVQPENLRKIQVEDERPCKRGGKIYNIKYDSDFLIIEVDTPTPIRFNVKISHEDWKGEPAEINSKIHKSLTSHPEVAEQLQIVSDEIKRKLCMSKNFLETNDFNGPNDPLFLRLFQGLIYVETKKQKIEEYGLQHHSRYKVQFEDNVPCVSIIDIRGKPHMLEELIRGTTTVDIIELGYIHYGQKFVIGTQIKKVLVCKFPPNSDNIQFKDLSRYTSVCEAPIEEEEEQEQKVPEQKQNLKRELEIEEGEEEQEQQDFKKVKEDFITVLNEDGEPVY